MLDKSSIVAECANSVKPSEAGGSAAMAVSRVSRNAADMTAAPSPTQGADGKARAAQGANALQQSS